MRPTYFRHARLIAATLIAAAMLPSAAATCAADLCYSSSVEDQGPDCAAESGRRAQTAALQVGDGSLLTITYSTFCTSYSHEDGSGQDSYAGVTIGSAQLFGALVVNWYGHDRAEGQDECRLVTTLHTIACPEGVEGPPFVLLPLP